MSEVSKERNQPAAAQKEPAAAPLEAFHYRIAGRVASVRPGAHAGRFDGDGAVLRAHVPLGQGADPRRIDLRASARDPFGTLLVRRYRQPANLLVAALVDVSASMRSAAANGPGVNGSRLETAARFVASLGYSAYRAGDRFACFSAADKPFTEADQLPSLRRSAGPEAATKLLSSHSPSHPPGQRANGMPALAARLPARAALVFVVSDFHWPRDLLDNVLNQLVAHQVVPVVIRERDELGVLPRRGLLRFADVESGAQRSLWLRPALHARLDQALAAHRNELEQRFAAHALRSLPLGNDFSGDDVSRYFLS